MFTEGDSFSKFFAAFFTQAAGHLALMGVLFWVVWVWGEERFRGTRIQEKKRFNKKQFFFELRNNLASIAVGTGVVVVLSLLYAGGFTRLSEDRADFSWYGIILGLFAFLLFNDLWFYAWHRLMHHPRLFRYVHAVHHKSVDVNPFTVYSFHPVEAFLLGSAVLVFSMIVPLYLPSLGVVQFIGLANNVISHLGYEFYPRWFIKVAPFRWLNTSTYHNLHHTRFQGNFGLMFRLWDRVFGTELPEYEQTFSRRGAP